MSGRRFTLPLIEVGGWRDRAACARSSDRRLWDDKVDGETERERGRRHDVAKLVCRTECPVRQECSDEADWRTDDGIRGGHKLPSLDSHRSDDEESDLLRLLRSGMSLDRAARRAR